jgi:hypothetical protein
VAGEKACKRTAATPLPSMMLPPGERPKTPPAPNTDGSGCGLRPREAAVIAAAVHSSEPVACGGEAERMPVWALVDATNMELSRAVDGYRPVEAEAGATPPVDTYNGSRNGTEN